MQPRFFETPAVTQDDNLARAYESRPEMQTVRSQERAADLEKRAARSQSLPKLSLAAAWSLQGTTPANMIPIYGFGASLEVPLFTGGRIQAETAAQDIEAVVQPHPERRRDVRGRS